MKAHFPEQLCLSVRIKLVGNGLNGYTAAFDNLGGIKGLLGPISDWDHPPKVRLTFMWRDLTGPTHVVMRTDSVNNILLLLDVLGGEHTGHPVLSPNGHTMYPNLTGLTSVYAIVRQATIAMVRDVLTV